MLYKLAEQKRETSANYSTIHFKLCGNSTLHLTYRWIMGCRGFENPKERGKEELKVLLHKIEINRAKSSKSPVEIKRNEHNG